MDYLLKKNNLTLSKDILDTVSQQPVDLDFTLPDYCADIEKILKCSLAPKIYSRNFSAGQLRVDGASVVRILYCDSTKKALRCCEQTVPFSATIPVSADPLDYIILTKAKPEYLNCRALTPRRLSIHGAFSLYVNIKEKYNCEISESSYDNALQTKIRNESVCELCEFLQEQFSVSESVSINAGVMVETVVRNEVFVDLKDMSRKGDKLALNIEATLKMLYISDAASGEAEQFVYVFPYTHLIDSKTESMDVSDVRLDVLSYELLLSSRMVSEEPVVNLELKLCASFLGYKQKEISYVCDAFSISDDIVAGNEDLMVISDMLPLSKNGVLKTTVAMGDKKVQKIVDIFCEEPVVSGALSENNLSVSGKLNVCVLAICEDGELISIERRVDIDIQDSLEKTYNSIGNLCFTVSSVSFRIGEDNELSLRFDTKLFAALRNSVNICQISDVEKTGEKLFDTKCPLTLYYAKSGESVWDIAKKYSSDVDVIRTENDIEEDEIAESGMLLIFNM